MASADPKTAEPTSYASGFRGTYEHLLNALRHPAGGVTDRKVKSAAAEAIEHLRAEVTRLEEFEWMYKDLCK